MARPLTVVVTCTDRKSLAVDPRLTLRTVTDTDLGDRLSTWHDRLAAAQHQVALNSLYMGEAWSQVQMLERATVLAGFAPTFLVASAGLGLRALTDTAPGYSATFSPGHPDSVPGDIDQQRAWWDGLTGTRHPHALDDVDAPILMILSHRYADVLADDVRGAQRTRDVLVIGGSSAISSTSRLPSDAALRRQLGGTLNSLNIRMASQWLAGVRKGQLSSPDAYEAWATWSQAHRKVERHQRRPLADSEVRKVIVDLLAKRPGMSKTSALRELRSRGFACEQRRFAELFLAVLEGAK